MHFDSVPADVLCFVWFGYDVALSLVQLFNSAVLNERVESCLPLSLFSRLLGQMVHFAVLAVGYYTGLH